MECLIINTQNGTGPFCAISGHFRREMCERYGIITRSVQGPLLVTWTIFHSSMDK